MSVWQLNYKVSKEPTMNSQWAFSLSRAQRGWTCFWHPDAEELFQNDFCAKVFKIEKYNMLKKNNVRDELKL